MVYNVEHSIIAKSIIMSFLPYSSLIQIFHVRVGFQLLAKERRQVDETSRVGLEFEVEGNRGRGRPRRRWRECLKKDMEMRRLEEKDAQERSGWTVGNRTVDPLTVWDQADRT